MIGVLPSIQCDSFWVELILCATSWEVFYISHLPLTMKSFMGFPILGFHFFAAFPLILQRGGGVNIEVIKK